MLKFLAVLLILFLTHNAVVEISFQLGKLIAFRRDVSNGSLLIAYRKGSRSYFPSSGQYPGYEVRSISF